MTQAPLARLLLLATLMIAALSVVKTAHGSMPAVSLSLHTPGLSLAVTL